MSGSPRADRKALIAARAELDRARITLAVHEIRTVVGPVSTADRVARMKPVAALIVGLAGPMAGTPRAARMLRLVWFALIALRAIRNWK